MTHAQFVKFRRLKFLLSIPLVPKPALCFRHSHAKATGGVRYDWRPLRLHLIKLLRGHSVVYQMPCYCFVPQPWATPACAVLESTHGRIAAVHAGISLILIGNRKKGGRQKRFAMELCAVTTVLDSSKSRAGKVICTALGAVDAYEFSAYKGCTLSSSVAGGIAGSSDFHSLFSSLFRPGPQGNN